MKYGLDFSSIPLGKVKTDKEGLYGDRFISEKGVILYYDRRGFKIMTNDPEQYLTEEDLEEVFYKQL